MPSFKKKFLALAIAAIVSTGLIACNGGSDDDDEIEISQPNPGMAFNRVASFLVCSQAGSSCESDDTTSAEIVAASSDGMTLIYTNSPKGEIGFVNIANPAAPVAIGGLVMGGEPTSVTVLGANVLVAVNTSANFINTSGKLAVVDIASRTVVAEIPLPGQPDSVAVSKDGKYIAVVIENERDEDLGDGEPPQAPAGTLVIVDVVGSPTAWTIRTVDMTGIATLFPTDPEPEYVDINEDNLAVVTLQENNHIALVDLKTGQITRHFSAGSVDLTQIDKTDERPNLVSLTETLSGRLREPDGATWISKDQFVTANEGDLNGGSRSFTVFNKDGTVAYEAGNAMEHLMARIGHYNDRRSDAKGNEPENAEFGRFEGTDYLFVASERSSVVAVYDLSTKNSPSYKQVLPAGVGPEGVLAIPGRNLLIAASEEDDRDGVIRSVVNIYQYQSAPANYPTLQSANRADGTPIPWGAQSGLAAASNTTAYSVNDSFFRANRIFEIDLSQSPAQIKSEIAIKDSNGVLAALAASLPDAKTATAFDDVDLAAMINADGTVNLDPEGISMASGGGFWIASEGAGTITGEGGTTSAVTKANLLLKVDANGVIQQVITLPSALDAVQLRFGFEGVAEADGKLVVAFQRAWNNEANPRIGVYDLNAGTWQFMYYPLDPVASPNGGWVGLSDIAALGNNQFLVVERDNQGGPDARVKRLYRIDLTGKTDGANLTKVLVRDLMADLKAPGGNVPEKIEGLAVLPNRSVIIVNDNDGVDGGSGETQLIKLGNILN
jgi:hypothetical protein